MAVQKLIINIQAKPFVASKMWHSWISIKGRHDKNTNLFISQWCTAIKRPFIIIHEGFCLIHFEQNTICLCVHTFGGQEGLRFCVRLDGFESISSLLTAQGHGSLWLCTALRFLLHAVFSLKAVLSQLSVPQSANAALALLTSQSSTCQPTHPHNPCTMEGAEMEKIKKKMEEKQRKILKKETEAGNGLWSKRQKTILSGKNRKSQSAQDQKASSSNLHRIHHLRGQTLSYRFPFTSSPLAAGQRKRQFPPSLCTSFSIPHG